MIMKQIIHIYGASGSGTLHSEDILVKNQAIFLWIQMIILGTNKSALYCKTKSFYQTSIHERRYRTGTIML